jgi:hypothetical protein
MTDVIENQETPEVQGGPAVAKASGLTPQQLHDTIVGLLNGSEAQDALNAILAIVPKCIQSMASMLTETQFLEILDFKIKSMYFDSSKIIFDRYMYLLDRSRRLGEAKEQAIKSIVQEAIQAAETQVPGQEPMETPQEELEAAVST